MAPTAGRPERNGARGAAGGDGSGAEGLLLAAGGDGSGADGLRLGAGRDIPGLGTAGRGAARLGAACSPGDFDTTTPGGTAVRGRAGAGRDACPGLVGGGLADPGSGISR
jgi:hypothetical protein